MEPELVADYECEVGELPLWHPMEKRLYWADITRGRMFRFDPATGSHEQFYQGDVVGGFTIQEDGALLLFMEKGAVAVWRDGDLRYIINEIPGEGENRFNDTIADPAGRVFCGTMPALDRLDERLGTLYRLDTDGSVTPLLHGLGVSNGMGFTPDRKQMYFTDSIDRSIYVFDYDLETGDISNQRVFAETHEGEGIPDGMTVDAEGYVWSARWDGWLVSRFSPDGSEDRRIRFPAKQVSSAAFGGADYSELYLTTAGGDNKAENGEGAGALFRVRPGVRGVPEFLSRIGL